MNWKTFATFYKPLVWGSLSTVLIFSVMNWIGVIRINPNSWLENIAIFTFWWLAFSFSIYKIPYFRKNKAVVYKILGLIGILIIAVLVDSIWGVPDNPITFPLIVIFWLGVAFLILPGFFQKYKVAILSVYGAILSYFLIFRMQEDYFQNRQEDIIAFLLVPIPVLIALWFYEQWRWLRSLQADKAKAELALLKSQINPHFFFNTLNNLYGLAVEKSDQAPEVILKLSDMMRYTIYEGKEEWVSLTDEISYLENYIDLHKIRFQKTVDIVFEQEIEQDWQVAPLLFIIFLENAFKHGAESLTEDAFIHLTLSATTEKLVFRIGNNFDPSRSIEEEGIGLSNLRKRLAHSYPDRHELIIEKAQSIYSAQLTLHAI